MHKLGAIVIFFTAFLITANMQIYIHSLRIGIYSWHIFLPVIPLQLIVIIMLASWKKLQLKSLLFIGWWTTILLAIAASLLFVNLEGSAVTLATRITTVAFISITFIVACQHPTIARFGLFGIAAAVFLAAGISVLEFIDPDFNAVVDQRYEGRTLEGQIQRVGGLYVNANLNACVMVLGMFASVFALPVKLRLIFCLFVGIGVFTTVSRSGMTAWVLAMGMLFMLREFTEGKIVAKAVGAIAVLGLVAALVTGTIPVLLELAGLDQYMTTNMVERLSGSFFSQGDSSTSSRKTLAMAAIELYSQHPILGVGLGGAAQLGEIRLGAHNTILDIAAELGTLGALAYLSIILIVLASRSAKAITFLILYFFLNMFIHGLLAMPALAFILPAGLVLLSQLDYINANSEIRTYNRGKRRKKRRKKSYQNIRTKPQFMRIN